MSLRRARWTSTSVITPSGRQGTFMTLAAETPTLPPLPMAPVTGLAAARPSRPKLARLDTSERIKSGDGASRSAGAATPTLRGKQVSPQLTLDTTTGNAPHAVSSPAQRQSSFVMPLERPSELGRGFVAAELIHNSPGGSRGMLSEPLQSQRRRGSAPDNGRSSLSALPSSLRSPISPTRSMSLSSGVTISTSFEPSEILAGFLYLGPEIATPSEAAILRERFGIRRILNAAWEIEEGGGRHLNLDDEAKSGFERYKKLPLKDTVEARGVQRYIEEACAFLDDARLHSAPTYVHCKAGKSRSVMLVMAYLIHSNRWSLQRSYAYVVDRRRDVSPNIGFVAELMAFEQKRLGSRARKDGLPVQVTAAQDETDDVQGDASDGDLGSWPDTMASAPVIASRRKHARESMPGKSTFTAEYNTHNADKVSPNTPTDTHPSQSGSEYAWQIRHEDKSGGVEMPSNEYRGLDGRYHVVRPPADERLLAPNRRTTLAAIDTENLFLRTQALNVSEKPVAVQVDLSSAPASGAFISSPEAGSELREVPR